MAYKIKVYNPRVIGNGLCTIYRSVTVSLVSHNRMVWVTKYVLQEKKENRHRESKHLYRRLCDCMYQKPWQQIILMRSYLLTDLKVLA